MLRYDKNFNRWLDKVAEEAHKNRKYIDPSEEYFRPLYDLGLTPEQAVEQMISDVGKAERKYDMRELV